MTESVSDRQYWLSVLERLARPVLSALAAGRLKRDIPLGTEGERPRRFIQIEAAGRLLAGIAPWLECRELAGNEADLRDELHALALRSLTNLADPDSPDRADFAGGQDIIVHGAFLAHALLRAPTQLWQPLDSATQRRLLDGLIATRQFMPSFNNWLLFTALTETMLRETGERWDRLRVDYALRQHEQWYRGDGAYADGPAFHWDYYNAFVIHPMMLEILDHCAEEDPAWRALRPKAIARARRFAEIQERMISPEGAFPPIGRSLSYRFGALQGLAHMALRRELPESSDPRGRISPAQVRCAMTAVIRRMIEAPNTFDDRGWLRIGFCGHQPGVGEDYIGTGSLYLCAAGLLPLGLPPSDPFWHDPPALWTSQKAWSGIDLPADHALREN